MYRVPVDFVVDAMSPEEAKILLEEFLLRAVTEYRTHYCIVDYDTPYGYPISKL